MNQKDASIEDISAEVTRLAADGEPYERLAKVIDDSGLDARAQGDLWVKALKTLDEAHATPGNVRASIRRRPYLRAVKAAQIAPETGAVEPKVRGSNPLRALHRDRAWPPEIEQ